MSRIGTVVKMLYGDQVKPAYNNSGADMDVKTSRRNKKFTALKKTLGSRRTLIWVIRIVVVLVVLFVAAESVFQFNRFATCQTKVMSRQADIEREYQRRENLIPNLVFAVSKYATYEKGVFKDIADARSELMKIQNSEISQSQINSVLEKALSRLVAWAEEYPDLKATHSVQDLIKEASNTEDRIADAKKEYNKECELYNQYLSVFPGNVFAFFYRFKPIPYIGLEDVNVPVIDLDITQGGVAIKGDVEVPARSKNMTGQKGDIE
jgi:LemA protein